MPDTPLPFSSHGSYPVRNLTQLDFLVDGEESFAAIARDIEGARTSVYMTCCYASLNFRLCPPDGEQLLDLCRRISNRGVTLAMLFWQPVGRDDRPDPTVPDTVPETLRTLITQRAPKVMARWDIAKGLGVYPDWTGCHHQKLFVIDGTIAWVGGINMVQSYWDTNAHLGDDDRRVNYDITDPGTRKARANAQENLPLHDLFARFTGPAVADVEANFVERWNGAATRDGANLSVDVRAAEAPKGAQIQVLRTIAPHTYPQSPRGEQSIREAILNLLATAERSVYFENQYFFDGAVIAALRAAATRGVRVVGLITRRPDSADKLGPAEEFLDQNYLARFQWSWIDPIIAQRTQIYWPFVVGSTAYKDVYVHAKAMIVDDRFVLLGSANISFTSLDYHSEMSILVDDADRAKSFRLRLWGEHLCLSPAGLPEAFEAGADLWIAHGQENLARMGKPPPLSRVLPVSRPAVGEDVPELLTGSVGSQIV